MFKLEDISEGQDYAFFYKIVENKFVENIVKNGQIYFGLLENYRKMEMQNMSEIGDRTEATLSKQIFEYLNIDGEYVEIHGPNVGYNARIDANQCVFCCYRPGLKQFQKISENEYRYVLSSNDIQTLCADKGGVQNCAIIIFDDNTIQKIYDELSKNNFMFNGKSIIYDDFDYIPVHKDISSYGYALECTFHKMKRYEYQHEFRITALNDEKKPIDNLYIPVDEKDFDVVSLQNGMDFVCKLAVNPVHTGDRTVEVHLNASFALI